MYYSYQLNELGFWADATTGMNPPATENPKAIGQIDSLSRGKAYAGGLSSNAATRMRGGVDTEGSSP